MALIYTPNVGRFQQQTIDKAKELAHQTMKIERELRMGEEGHLISPMKYFIFDKQGECYPFWGEIFGPPQEHPKMDGKAQIGLIVKIMVHALDSSVVFHVTEGYSADKCHNCGEKYSNAVWKGEECECECGVERCQPSDNPYHNEILLGNLIYNSGQALNKEDVDEHGLQYDAYIWHYIMHREKKNGKVIRFEPTDEGKYLKMGGRMCEHWAIQNHEAPYIMLYVPRFAKAFGKEVDPKRIEIAEFIEATWPTNYPKLSFGITDDIDAVCDMLKDEHERHMSQFN